MLKLMEAAMAIGLEFSWTGVFEAEDFLVTIDGRRYRIEGDGEFVYFDDAEEVVEYIRNSIKGELNG